MNTILSRLSPITITVQLDQSVLVERPQLHFSGTFPDLDAFLKWARDAAKVRQHRKRRKGKTSKYRGVSKYGSRWQVAVRESGAPVKRLGVFDDEEEAARVYDAWALEYYGHKAYVNFPSSKERTIAECQR